MSVISSWNVALGLKNTGQILKIRINIHMFQCLINKVYLKCMGKAKNRQKCSRKCTLVNDWLWDVEIKELKYMKVSCLIIYICIIYFILLNILFESAVLFVGVHANWMDIKDAECIYFCSFLHIFKLVYTSETQLCIFFSFVMDTTFAGLFKK